jgi:signal transduction histidine kinase
VKRFAPVALGAVSLAAAVLAVLGYLSLRQWEASAELLFREQARDMAAMAAEKVEMTILKAEEECLSALQVLLLDSGLGREALEGWARKASIVERAYVLDRQGRVLYPPEGARGDAPVFTSLLAEISQGFWDRGGRRHIVAGDRVVLAAVLQSAPGGPVLAALVRDDEAVRREVLERTLGGLAGKSVLAVLDASDRAVYATQPLAGAARVLTVPLGETLPRWRVALYQPEGLSPGEAVRRQASLFTVAFALLLVVIVFGLGMTFRLVRRESEMARLKSDFVANVSHDLKTPLSLIRMFAETLEMDRVTSDATRQEYYAVITRESERLTRLINNVLDFSRIEEGRQRYDIRPTAVEPVVQEALDVFRHPLAQQGFKVEVNLAPDLPEVPMDAAAIGQALANLVDNAIKYSAESRRLVVAARRAGGEVLLEVADDGIGIPTSELGRVFDKFYRVGRSETQGRRGSGLGLSLVKHIVESHGGRVRAESAPGAGSRFTIHLPVHGAPTCRAS